MTKEKNTAPRKIKIGEKLTVNKDGETLEVLDYYNGEYKFLKEDGETFWGSVRM